MTVQDLNAIGISRMTEDERQQFLSNQGVGVLGLPAEEGPYLLPISFGYDGDESLYFTYVVGTESRKETLSQAAETASFLVYDVTSKFMWQSVSMTGKISDVPERQWETVEDALDNAWRPDVFASGNGDGNATVYRFQIDEIVGLKQNGLPPEFEPDG